jgi:hypothetical protein
MYLVATTNPINPTNQNQRQNMTTITKFLQTDMARRAAEHSGYSTIGDFQADSDGRVGIAMDGHYTVDEMRAKLADVERVQQAYEAWRDDQEYRTRNGLPVGFGRPDITTRGRR